MSRDAVPLLQRRPAAQSPGERLPCSLDRLRVAAALEQGGRPISQLIYSGITSLDGSVGDEDDALDRAAPDDEMQTS